MTEMDGIHRSREEARGALQEALGEIKRVIVGQDAMLERLLVSLLAGGATWLVYADEQDSVNARLESTLNTTARLLEMCRQITIPALLVHGAESDVVSLNGIGELRARLPQLEIGTVPGAGHMIAGDRNEAFNVAIMPFLERHPPTV